MRSWRAEQQMPYDKVTEDFYDKCVDINAKGVFFTIQKANPLMDKNGSIILNASFIGSSGFPGMAVYGATKAAIHRFARTFTAELKGACVLASMSSAPGRYRRQCINAWQHKRSPRICDQNGAAWSHWGRQ
jgi:NAD(P)-dependent dehydrogenase (short-subunit alcohol dehydrogenase family)